LCNPFWTALVHDSRWNPPELLFHSSPGETAWPRSCHDAPRTQSAHHTPSTPGPRLLTLPASWFPGDGPPDGWKKWTDPTSFTRGSFGGYLMLENRGSIEEHQTGLWKLSMGTCRQKTRDAPTIVGSKIEIIGCWILDGTTSSATHHVFSHKVSNNYQSRSSNARINQFLLLSQCVGSFP
jgi:hypothetical protein